MWEYKVYKMTKEELKKIIKNKSVLFVDDEEFLLETMKDILPILFGNVYFAKNGIEGLEIFKNYYIDIVITDLNMPKMDGIEMLKQINKINPTIKSICVSGHNENELIKEVKELNSVFIIKPISSTELYNALSEILC
jgi:YesN/AraC family two-component response regulator